MLLYLSGKSAEVSMRRLVCRFFIFASTLNQFCPRNAGSTEVCVHARDKAHYQAGLISVPMVLLSPYKYRVAAHPPRCEIFRPGVTER